MIRGNYKQMCVTWWFAPTVVFTDLNKTLKLVLITPIGLLCADRASVRPQFLCFEIAKGLLVCMIYLRVTQGLGVLT